MEFKKFELISEERWLATTLRRVSAVIAVILFFAPITLVHAESLESTRQQYNSASKQGNDIQNNVNQQAAIAATIEGQIAAMNNQITAVSARIADTKAQITDVNAQIMDVKAKMAVKQQILNAYIQEQYYSPAPSAFELVVSASSLSEVVDNKEYLDRAQEHINGLLAEVQAIKKILDAKKGDLTKLSDTLAIEQAGLDQQRVAKSQLLEQTRGEQAKYEQMLRDNQAARARLSATIATLAGNGPLQSKGYVTRGTRIGSEGSTGFSTGCHVHWGTYSNGRAVNPHPYLNSGRIGWPKIGGVTTQGYGPAGWSNPVYSFHDGIDISSGCGTPILAACDGNIVINSFQAGGFGHYILLDCGDGLTTVYGHMQ